MGKYEILYVATFYIIKDGYEKRLRRLDTRHQRLDTRRRMIDSGKALEVDTKYQRLLLDEASKDTLA